MNSSGYLVDKYNAGDPEIKSIFDFVKNQVGSGKPRNAFSHLIADHFSKHGLKPVANFDSLLSKTYNKIFDTYNTCIRYSWKNKRAFVSRHPDRMADIRSSKISVETYLNQMTSSEKKRLHDEMKANNWPRYGQNGQPKSGAYPKITSDVSDWRTVQSPAFVTYEQPSLPFTPDFCTTASKQVCAEKNDKSIAIENLKEELCQAAIKKDLERIKLFTEALKGIKG